MDYDEWVKIEENGYKIVKGKRRQGEKFAEDYSLGWMAYEATMREEKKNGQR